MHVSIIILNWNTLELTDRCLASVREHTDTQHQIILIDNGSNDGSHEHFSQLSQAGGFTYVRNPENVGFAAGCNQGIELATGDYVCLLNSDTRATPGWLTNMLASLQRDSRVGIVGPLTDGLSYPFAQSQKVYGHTQPDQYTNQRLPFFCVLMPRHVVQEVGPLDTRFGLGNFEDDDYCRRLALKGYRFLICGSAFVHHEVSATFKANQVDTQSLHDKNIQLYHQKWQSQ